MASLPGGQCPTTAERASLPFTAGKLREEIVILFSYRLHLGLQKDSDRPCSGHLTMPCPVTDGRAWTTQIGQRGSLAQPGRSLRATCLQRPPGGENPRDLKTRVVPEPSARRGEEPGWAAVPPPRTAPAHLHPETPLWRVRPGPASHLSSLAGLGRQHAEARRWAGQEGQRQGLGPRAIKNQRA